jgi:hypothetical protein
MVKSLMERPVFDDASSCILGWHALVVHHMCLSASAEARAFVAVSVADKIVDSVFTAGDDRVDPRLQEPRKPPNPADFDLIDSGCNLPVTNPQTVAHFSLESFAWSQPN